MKFSFAEQVESLHDVLSDQNKTVIDYLSKNRKLEQAIKDMKINFEN